VSEPPSNILLLLSDEHRPDAFGCAGHDTIATPNLDRLAADGARFTDAYCPSPLCAPCRAAFTTGRYVHEVEAWDNAASYGGDPPSWGAHFENAGVRTTTVGKLDFQPDVQGFPEQLLPAFRRSPDVNGIQRDPPIIREGSRERITKAGPTDELGRHERADRERTDRAIEWLEARAEADEDGWILSLNWILPHFPLTAERSYYERYDDLDELPYDYPAADDHPILEELRDHFQGRDVDRETLRRTRRAYYALCTELDDNVGQVLDALDRLGLAEDTLVIYTSDHGEPLGDHETWWKCTMHEQSVGIPLLTSGPGVESATIEAPVSLLDLVPTMGDALGVDRDLAWRGVSQWPVLTGARPPDHTRAVLSEYHAHGTSRGTFMLRQGRYKYVHYVDNPDQLFDLRTDPDELEDLADAPAYDAVRRRLEQRLRERVTPDPETVDQRARRDQIARNERPVDEWWGTDA
jgi:choline-sulfatase